MYSNIFVFVLCLVLKEKWKKVQIFGEFKNYFEKEYRIIVNIVDDV